MRRQNHDDNRLLFLNDGERIRMKTSVRWIGDVSFAGITGSGHTVAMDGAPENASPES